MDAAGHDGDHAEGEHAAMDAAGHDGDHAEGEHAAMDAAGHDGDHADAGHDNHAAAAYDEGLASSRVFLPYKAGYTVPGLLEIGIFLGFLGGFLFFVFSSLAKAPLEPKKDPYFEESLHHHT
jgi:hypothetical protein